MPLQPQITELEPSNTLGEGFLRAIPEQDRAIVAKYIKDWDGNVTRKFQEIHEQYAPYKTLGEIEAIQQAIQMNQFLQENPVEFYRLLAETIDEMKEQGYIVADEEEYYQPPSNVDDSQLTETEQIRRELQELREWREQQEQSWQERAEMDELDTLLSKMHNDYGDFDDDWVLLQLSRNVAPEDAVKNWNSLLESRVSSFRTTPPPRILGGNGQVPGNQVDLSKMTGPERVKFVAEQLAAANSQG